MQCRLGQGCHSGAASTRSSLRCDGADRRDDTPQRARAWQLRALSDSHGPLCALLIAPRLPFFAVTMIAAVSQLQLGLTLGGRPAVASRAGAVNMKVGLVYSTTTGNTETVRRAAVPSCWLSAPPLHRSKAFELCAAGLGCFRPRAILALA